MGRTSSDFLLNEMTGPGPRCTGPSWEFWIREPGLNARAEWGDVGQLLRDGFPMLDMQKNLTNLLSDCSAAKQALLQLARLLMRPVVIEELVPGYVHTVNERQSCWVASIHHDLCGQALALTADVLRYGLRVASEEPQRAEQDRTGETLDRLVQRVNTFLGYSLRCRSNEFTAAMLRQAERFGMPAILIDTKEGLFSIGACKGSRLICSSSNDGDSYFGAVICNQKQKTNMLLRRLGLPVPRQFLVTSEAHLSAAIREVGYPCVVKPASAERGQGVTVGIQGEEELKAAFTKAKQIRSDVLVEQQVNGLDHRLTVINGAVRFAIRREPPAIRGTGLHRINELINQENEIRQQRRDVDGVSGLIEIDDEVIQMLAKAGFSPEDILPNATCLYLRRNANVSTGGTFTDVTSQVHPEVARMCGTLSETLRMNVLGVDYLCEDISTFKGDDPGNFIEINSMPQMTAKRAGEVFQAAFPAGVIKMTHKVTVLLVDPVRFPDLARLSLFRKVRSHPDAWTLATPTKGLVYRQWYSMLPNHAVRGYSHPNEVLLDASIHNCLFVLDLQEFERRGLPFKAPASLGTLLTSASLGHPATQNFFRELVRTEITHY